MDHCWLVYWHVCCNKNNAVGASEISKQALLSRIKRLVQAEARGAAGVQSITFVQTVPEILKKNGVDCSISSLLKCQ